MLFPAVAANVVAVGGWLVVLLGFWEGVGAFARALAFVSICLVAVSKLATCDAMIVEADWSRPFSVYSRNISRRSRILDCSSCDLVRVHA